VDEVTEIAVPEWGRGHRNAARAGGAKLVPLICEEEEGAVPAIVDLRDPHRRAERPTEFVANQVGRLEIKILARAGHTQTAVAQGFENRAMHLIAARARRQHESPRPVELG